jgi:hypothetical protein
LRSVTPDTEYGMSKVIATSGRQRRHEAVGGGELRLAGCAAAGAAAPQALQSQ